MEPERGDGVYALYARAVYVYVSASISKQWAMGKDTHTVLRSKCEGVLQHKVEVW